MRNLRRQNLVVSIPVITQMRYMKRKTRSLRFSIFGVLCRSSVCTLSHHSFTAFVLTSSDIFHYSKTCDHGSLTSIASGGNSIDGIKAPFSFHFRCVICLCLPCNVYPSFITSGKVRMTQLQLARILDWTTLGWTGEEKMVVVERTG